MRVALIGGPRFGVQEPMAGGMESLITALAAELDRTGFDVTVFAGTGDGAIRRGGVKCVPFLMEPFVPSPDARADVSMPPERFMAEHHAFLVLGTMLRTKSFDVVHNHSLHYLPPLFDLACPMVHTLHSPPTSWLESAHACRTRQSDIVVSVSRSNAARWGALVDRVVSNGVDVARWGRGRCVEKTDAVVWTGRLVPEKAPHLAIEAARIAGREIDLAGPIHDQSYFDEMVRPELGADARYVGHLGIDALVALVGRGAVAVATPVWDEPYGLVVAEALAAGTPVAAFARGGVCEIVDSTCGALAQPDDPGALAAAIERASTLTSAACHDRASRACSVQVMTERYADIYRDVCAASRSGR
jgi:glycosyltransferase involved in cell wall biosynthesis